MNLPSKLTASALIGLIALNPLTGSDTDTAEGSAFMKKAPVPSWVVAIEIDPGIEKQTLSDDQGEGLVYLVSDEVVDLATETRYVRMAYKIVSSSGLSDAAQVSAFFDPTYQTLLWHDITVTRNGEVVYRINIEDIEVSRRYEDLEWSTYDSSYTAFLLLDDLRVGDVVDTEYSLVGFNPVFAHKLSERAYLQWSVPVKHARVCYRVPEGRSFYYLESGNLPSVALSEADGTRTYSWRIRDSARVEYDWDSPPDWNPFARVEVSEFGSWADVVNWAEPLYPPVDLPESVLAAIPLSLEDAIESPATAAAIALRFIQEEIRYLSVVIGEGTHRPSNPAVCLDRRYGDCKDKAYFFCNLVKAFGIEAVPALVSTEELEAIANRLPAPTVFDHVIVRMDLPDGRRLWVDPTRVNVGGPLSGRAIDRYGLALPIAPGVTELEEVPVPDEAADVTTIKERFVVRSLERLEEPVYLEVATVYRGRAADTMRSHLAETSRSELEQDFLEYYALTYPEIEAYLPYTVDDQRNDNRLELTEHYQIRGFWQQEEENGPYSAELFPQAVYDQMERPSRTMRASPFAIDHPVKITQNTTVVLNERWPVSAGPRLNDNRWFRVTDTSETTDDGFNYTTTYETLQNRVEAKDVPAFSRELDRVATALGYEITWDPNSAERPVGFQEPDPFRILLFIVVLGLSVVGILAWARRSGPPPEPVVGPTGLAGWLIVLILIQIWRVYSVTISLIQGGSIYFVLHGWNETVLSSNSGSIWIEALLWVEFVSFPALIANLTLIMVFFVKEHRAFPKLIILSYVLTLIRYRQCRGIPAILRPRRGRR